MRRAIVVLLALLASTAAFAQTGPDLYVAVDAGYGLPGLPFSIDIHYGNLSQSAAATNAILLLTSTQPFVSVSPNCSFSGTQAACNLGTIPAQSGDLRLAASLRAPEGSETPYQLTAEIRSSETDAAPANNLIALTRHTALTCTVTTTADSGSGSLREAMLTLNATGCTIVFRIPNATTPWVTIAPETPLPVLTFPGTEIYANTQTLYFGDTNPRGPEVELSGVKQSEGNGIFFDGCNSFLLSGLTINGFPGNGVLLGHGCTGGPGAVSYVFDSYIGTDPTGTKAVPNQRGVYVDGIQYARIGKNVISGNQRSGVYVQSGRTDVLENRIGLSSELKPLGNGASGVYVGAGAHGTDVSNNFIGFNAHWGIAIDQHAAWVNASPNSIQANFGLGIDWGYDMNPANGPVAVPEITSARVENGKTIIEGTKSVPGPGILDHEVHLYASDAPHWTGYGEGQYTLGSIVENGPRFTATLDVDLRGKFVTVTLTESVHLGFARSPRGDGIHNDTGTTTSEFSHAVLVR